MKSIEEKIKSVEKYIWNLTNQFLPYASASVTRDDLWQEAVMKIIEKADQWSPDRGAWSTFIVPHIKGAITGVIRKKSQIPVVFTDRSSEAEEGGAPMPADKGRFENPEIIASINELRRNLESVIDELRVDEKWRTAIWMFAEGHTFDAIGKEIGHSKQWTETKLHEIMARMRSNKQLERMAHNG